MKTLTTLFSCLLGILFFSTIALGQPPTSADQSNYPAVAQSISDHFGSTIAATTTEIESFLQAALVGAGPDCGYPDAVVESYDANSITFEWLQYLFVCIISIKCTTVMYKTTICILEYVLNIIFILFQNLWFIFN